MCQWLCSSTSSGQREPTTCHVKRRCQLRCQCRCDQHDTQPNESPHCTFVATVVSAAATLGAIDEHVLLSGAARHGRACVRMAAVLVFVGLCIAHLTLATLPDRRLAAAPRHLALPAVPRWAGARRVGTRVSHAEVAGRVKETESLDSLVRAELNEIKDVHTSAR